MDNKQTKKNNKTHERKIFYKSFLRKQNLGRIYRNEYIHVECQGQRHYRIGKNLFFCISLFSESTRNRMKFRMFSPYTRSFEVSIIRIRHPLFYYYKGNKKGGRKRCFSESYVLRFGLFQNFDKTFFPLFVLNTIQLFATQAEVQTLSSYNLQQNHRYTSPPILRVGDLETKSNQSPSLSLLIFEMVWDSRALFYSRDFPDQGKEKDGKLFRSRQI